MLHNLISESSHKILLTVVPAKSQQEEWLAWLLRMRQERRQFGHANCTSETAYSMSTFSQDVVIQGACATQPCRSE